MSLEANSCYFTQELTSELWNSKTILGPRLYTSYFRNLSCVFKISLTICMEGPAVQMLGFYTAEFFKKNLASWYPGININTYCMEKSAVQMWFFIPRKFLMENYDGLLSREFLNRHPRYTSPPIPHMDYKAVLLTLFLIPRFSRYKYIL